MVNWMYVVINLDAIINPMTIYIYIYNSVQFDFHGIYLVDLSIEKSNSMKIRFHILIYRLKIP